MDDNRYNNYNSSNNGYNNTGYNPNMGVMVGDDWDTGRNRKKKNGGGRGKTALLLVLCCLLTAVGGGIAGSYITAGILEDRAQENTATQLQIPVATQNNAITETTLSSGGKLSSEQVVAKAQASVVGLILEGQDGLYQSEGNASGVITSTDGYIVTNYHVVNGMSKVTVVMPDGSYKEADIIGKDEITDLAVLKVDATGLTPMTFADSSQVKVGQKVYAIGNPLGAENASVTQGIISAIDREIEIDEKTMTLLQTDAAINPGNSGGALVNENGELVGVVNAKTAGVEIEGLGYAIPANEAKNVAEQIVSQGYVSGRPQLGISAQEVAVGSGRNNGGYGGFFMPEGLGYGYEYQLQIVSVEKGSAAEDAGLQAGDIILEFGGKSVSSVSELNSVKFEYEVGDTVAMKISRDGQEMEVNIVLKENTTAQ